MDNGIQDLSEDGNLTRLANLVEGLSNGAILGIAPATRSSTGSSS